MDDSDFIPRSSLSSKVAVSSVVCTDKTAAGRPKKLTIESDCLLPNSDKEKCFVCDKDLRHLNDVRKSLHINSCLDRQEANSKYGKEKETWSRTVDCPICGEPLQPGPHRAAHAKRCGRKHEVAGSKLLTLMETQTKVAEVRMKNGLSHTKMKEPKLEVPKPSSISGAPRSEFEEQMKLAMALSESVSSLDGDLEVIGESRARAAVASRPRRPPRRSFSFVELEPRDCKCSVFEEIQENFIKRFDVKRRSNSGDLRATIQRRALRSAALIGDVVKCLRKLDRLERLADDIGRYGSSGGDVTMFSLENESVQVHRFIVAARAPQLLSMIDDKNCITMRDFSASALRCYSRFLYSSSMEWTEKERKEILRLAESYGPPGLVALCRPVDLTEQSLKKTTETVDELNASVRKISEAVESAAEVAQGSEDVVQESPPTSATAHEAALQSSAPNSFFTFIETDSESGTSTCADEQHEQLATALMDRHLDVGGHHQLPKESQHDSGGEERSVVLSARERKRSLAELSGKPSRRPIQPLLTASGLADIAKSIAIDDEKAADSDDSVIFVSEVSSAESQEQGKRSNVKRKSCAASADDELSKRLTDLMDDILQSDRSEVDDNADSASQETNDDKDSSQDIFNDDLGDNDCTEEKSVKGDCLATGSFMKDHSDDGATQGTLDDADDKPTTSGKAAAEGPVEGACGAVSSVCAGGRGALMDSFFLSPIALPNDSFLRSLDFVTPSSHSAENSPHRSPQQSPYKDGAAANKWDSPECSPRASTSSDWPVEPRAKMRRVEAAVRYCSTPLPQAGRLMERIRQLGSDVKVLKTSNITPLPNFEAMTNNELKDELAKYGVRALGRKRSILLLRRIYEATHPVIDEFSPLTRRANPKRIIAPVSLANRLSEVHERDQKKGAECDGDDQREGSDDDDNDEGILNRSLDERNILEESSLDSTTDEGAIPKNLEEMQIALVSWLRKDANEDLLNSLLALHPVMFDKFAERVSMADSVVATIPKKALMEILDRLHITFSLPADAWKRRYQRNKK